jgi:predicted RNA-binding protein with PUA-like domain
LSCAWLSKIKSKKELENIWLVKQPRLAVMEVKKDEFLRIIEMKIKSTELLGVILGDGE